MADFRKVSTALVRLSPPNRTRSPNASSQRNLTKGAPSPGGRPRRGQAVQTSLPGLPQVSGGRVHLSLCGQPQAVPSPKASRIPLGLPGHRHLSAAVRCRCSSEPCPHPTQGQSRMTTWGTEARPGRGYSGSADPSPALQEPPGSALPSPSAFLAWRGCPPRTMQSGQPAPPAETGLRGLSCWSGGAPHPPQSTSCDHDALPQHNLWSRIYAGLYPTEPLEVNLWRIFSRGKETGHPQGLLKTPTFGIMQISSNCQQACSHSLLLSPIPSLANH